MKKGRNISEAAEIIRRGGLVAFPTETVYGLGADTFNPAAVANIFAVKKRPSFDPLIVHIAELSDLKLLSDGVGKNVFKLIDKFWPGPLTLILPRKQTVPDIVTSGLSTVAVRMPAHPVALDLIRRSGTPIAAPSANRFGFLSPTLPSHVEKQLPEIDYLYDGEACILGIESTIVEINDETFTILRPGAISELEISKVLPLLKVNNKKKKKDSYRSPGLLKSHYSPSKPLFIIDKSDNLPANSGFISFKTPLIKTNAKRIEILSEKGDLNEAAVNLFAALHRLEESDVSRIYAEAVPEIGIGIAIMDRLRKASYQYSL